MWKGHTQAEIASVFADLFPEAGAVVDPLASTSLRLQDADSARRIAGVYWLAASLRT
ncbi:hypothetical protein OVA03_07705 [Asticcacaulis sp. SL142]|uniref:hypothetical protein n=1 Tax=Asticcacaulis sp. SL142 TaxID=2995155 RepID=UPI00226C8722|nr:hypothetical protein [Asticcacaulis sp. SL142]WAC49774.1 hypothetical protein OVA03_07705 [Asticcacaulis sp. SL142]